jgi:hypothetical protein
MNIAYGIVNVIMKLVHIYILFIFLPEFISAQIFVEKHLEDGINSIVDFINSDKYQELKNKNSDLALIDTIYLRAKKFHNDDIAETLLTLTFATIPFEIMPLHIPYSGILFKIKLPSGDPYLIDSKIENLPKKIFEDSPASKFGDKDKIAHFFGNAYFSYSVTLFNLSKFLSIFVELFEDAFKVDGGIDNRDYIANYLGYEFGQELLVNPNSLPSLGLNKYSSLKNNFLKTK